MDNTAEFLLDDILNPYSQMTLGVIEDRLRALPAAQLIQFEKMLKTRSGEIETALLEDINALIASVRNGAAGIASVLPESRPCKAGDVHRVTSDEWDSNLALKKVAWEVPGHKDLRTAGSDAVRLMQRALIQWGCRQATPARYPLPTYGVDGDYGQETKNAVRQFQRDQQLVADGVAGPKTVRAMQANLGFLEVRDQVDIDSLYEYAKEIGANGASSLTRVSPLCRRRFLRRRGRRWSSAALT